MSLAPFPDLNAALTDCDGAERSRVRVPIWEALALAIITIILSRGLVRIPKAIPNPAPGMAAVINFAIVTNTARAAQGGAVCPVYLSGYRAATGSAMFEVTDHIGDSGGPRYLTSRGERAPSGWVTDMDTCDEEARNAEAARRGVSTKDLQCDEYPFASTWEGGEEHKDWVSLRLVLARHNSVQGGTLSGFLRKCGLNQGDRFKVETWNGITKYYTDESKTRECP